MSDGFAFINSFNTERAWGGDLEGKPPLESGASQNDMDYLHVIDWKKAEAAVAAGKTETINGMRVIRLPTAIAEGVLYFVPEPKSPHGVDVTPDGKDIVVRGKLDTHVTVYSLREDQGADRRRRSTSGKDPYGVPILPFEDSHPRRRSRSASGRCTRSSTTRATPTPRSSSSRRSPSGRWPRTCKRDREDPRALQHRPPRRRRGRHRAAPTASTWSR